MFKFLPKVNVDFGISICNDMTNSEEAEFCACIYDWCCTASLNVFRRRDTRVCISKKLTAVSLYGFTIGPQQHTIMETNRGIGALIDRSLTLRRSMLTVDSFYGQVVQIQQIPDHVTRDTDGKSDDSH